MKPNSNSRTTRTHTRTHVEALEQRIAPAALIGLDNSNNLQAFDYKSPGTVTTVAVTGLGAGEVLIGIDFRAATGGLYGITSDGANAGRIYLINPTTGAAAFSAKLAADPADLTSPFTSLSGTNFGIDFNPVPDRLRLVSDTNQNVRINVDSGLVTTDSDLNPGGSTISGAAYTNSFADAAATALYDIDLAGDKLMIQNPPNNGTLSVVGSGLGIGDVTGVGGFDIVSARSASGTVTNGGYAVLTVGGTTALYGVDLSTGVATSLGAIGAGDVALRGLTASISTPTAKAFTINAADNHLLSFNVATPNVTTDIGAVTGLGGGETTIGFDFRPADGALYAVTKDGANVGRIYSLNTTTGAATLSFALAADPTDVSSPFTSLSGTNFGVDFNPFADRLRIVSDTGQNLRVNVTTGLVITDTDLNGATTAASAVAYANNFAGALSTTLFDIDATTDQLLLQNPPNAGTLTVVGSLGVNASAVNGFDIRTNGEAFATLTVGGVASLYSIDLTTGAATAVGAVGSGVANTLGLALVPSGALQFSAPTLTVGEAGGSATFTINRTGGSDGAVTAIVTPTDGTAFAGSDFSSLSRVVSFGPGVTSVIFSLPIVDDAVFEGDETFTATLSNAVGGAQLGATKISTVTITDNEAKPTLSIADVSQSEGNAGNTAFTFTISLSGAAQADVTGNFLTTAGTAALGRDFGASAGAFQIAGGQLSTTVQVQALGDIAVESTETFNVHIQTASSSATVADDTGIGSILNDDGAVFAANGKSATFTDLNGNLVTITTTRGTLTSANLLFTAPGSLGGAALTELDLHTGGFDGANLTLTAKRGPLGGDGFINVGYLDASGIALGGVTINGDLGHIDAGAVKTLTVQSLGKLGSSAQPVSGSLLSIITGNLGTLAVKTDIEGATLGVGGKITTIKLGGNLHGIDADAPGAITVGGDIGSATIAGSIFGGTADHTGSIETGGKLGTLTLGGSLKGGTGTASGSIIAKTAGALKVRGDLDGGHIFLSGNLAPAKTSAALALTSLTVGGSVKGSNLLIGYDRTGAPVNANVAVGAVSVTGDWAASNLVSGVRSSDGIFGNDDDSEIAGATAAIIRRIAKVTIKGQILGTPEIGGDGFGFVAAQIGSFKVGATALTLASNFTQGIDNFLVGNSGDVRVREFVN